jgi:hypothetical protein
LTINRVADLIEKESEFKQFFGMEWF